MLKRKIDKAAYDAMPDILKAEYKANGDGYVLDCDDATELLQARDNANRERDTALASVNEIKQQLKDAKTALTAAQSGGNDFTAMENSYKTKIATLESSLADANTKLTAASRDLKCGPVADKIASAFTAPALIKDRIMARLDIDPRSGEVRILDAAGKPSAATSDDLRKEFVDNPDYKAIVVASKASGSADAGNRNSGGSAPTPPPENTPLSRMTPQQLAAHMATKAGANA